MRQKERKVLVREDVGAGVAGAEMDWLRIEHNYRGDITIRVDFVAS